jgi:hypothetical protein
LVVNVQARSAPSSEMQIAVESGGTTLSDEPLSPARLLDRLLTGIYWSGYGLKGLPRHQTRLALCPNWNQSRARGIEQETLDGQSGCGLETATVHFMYNVLLEERSN